MLKLAFFLLAVACVSRVDADVYMHNPRGSNNRLNENSANRNNAARGFDSQNNNRGGYNVGDRTASAAETEDEQYQMKYFQSGDQSSPSHLTIEWTNQHGCGGNEDDDPHKLNCNIVLQYMCQPADVGQAKFHRIRDGLNTETQDYDRPETLEEDRETFKTRRANLVSQDRFLQEPLEWYDKCFVRERNKGLFTADQNIRRNNGLKVSSAIYTRQNRNGNRRGYECPEERDYYPYWHPTPWKDIVVLAENASLCDSHYKPKSFNTQKYGECVESGRHFSRYNNQEECEQEGHQWVEFANYLELSSETNQVQCEAAGRLWAVPYDAVNGNVEPQCLVPLPEVECMEAPWTRVNHNGNGRDGVPLNFTWVLPNFPSGTDQKCALRIRYNISTDDYDPYNTDSSSNGDNSPITTDPDVDMGAGLSPLRLNINTAQFGRVFQDRSHSFILRARPDSMVGPLYNLNVRGKRGNIVQTYPAVEYDFIPNDLHLHGNDMVHVQWTGSNTHNNGRPAGDGQSGDAGQGEGGTDRNNFLELLDRNHNYPKPFEQSTFWDGATVKWIYHGNNALTDSLSLGLNMASSGYYQCASSEDCGANSVDDRDEMQAQLNNAPASYEGVVLKLTPGVYHYMSTRNNAFTNRSQKGTIHVHQS